MTMSSDVRHLPNVDASDLRARLVDVCERRQTVCIRWERPGGVVACIVGVVAIVDAKAIRVVYGGSRCVCEPYTLFLVDVLSVVELSEPPPRRSPL